MEKPVEQPAGADLGLYTTSDINYLPAQFSVVEGHKIWLTTMVEAKSKPGNFWFSLTRLLSTVTPGRARYQRENLCDICSRFFYSQTPKQLCQKC